MTRQARGWIIAAVLVAVLLLALFITGGMGTLSSPTRA